MASIAGGFSRRIKAAERRSRNAARWDLADDANQLRMDILSAALNAGEFYHRVEVPGERLGYIGGGVVVADVVVYADNSALGFMDDGSSASEVGVIRGGAAVLGPALAAAVAAFNRTEG